MKEKKRKKEKKKRKKPPMLIRFHRNYFPFFFPLLCFFDRFYPQPGQAPMQAQPSYGGPGFVTAPVGALPSAYGPLGAGAPPAPSPAPNPAPAPSAAGRHTLFGEQVLNAMMTVCREGWKPVPPQILIRAVATSMLNHTSLQS